MGRSAKVSPISIPPCVRDATSAIKYVNSGRFKVRKRSPYWVLKRCSRFLRRGEGSMNDNTTNVLVVGVGGQGVILASDIMSEVFMQAGYDVKKSEVHGMAMRGGIVTSHFRFGKKVYSPLIKQGQVDILFAFEQLEGLRWIYHVRPTGKILMNDNKVNPPAVNLGEMDYPKNIPETIQSKFKDFYLVKGT